MWKYPNAQWALYPNGGGISTRGAVTPAWFYNRPYPAHVDASDLEVTFYWPAEYSGPESTSNVLASFLRKVPHFSWLFSQSFLSEETQSSTLNLSPLLTGTPPVSTECRNRMSPIRASQRLISRSQSTTGATPRTSRTGTPRSFSTVRCGSIPRASCEHAAVYQECA